jgi:CHAT domain-containing protein
LFPHSEKLLGSHASEQNLEQLATAGQLSTFRFIHIATHGVLNHDIPMRSALILSQDALPDATAQVLAGKPLYDGRLTAERILRTWKLQADLVTLSACETGLGKLSGGEGHLGFAQALFVAGAQSLVLSLWKVHDTATALLMTRFYQNLLGTRPGLDAPMPKAQALHEAKHWLKNLSAEEVGRLTEQLPNPTRAAEQGADLPTPGVVHPYEHPFYWAAFILIGDPGDLVPEQATPPPASTFSTLWLVVGSLLAGSVFVGTFVAWRRSRRPHPC